VSPTTGGARPGPFADGGKARAAVCLHTDASHVSRRQSERQQVPRNGCWIGGVARQRADMTDTQIRLHRQDEITGAAQVGARSTGRLRTGTLERAHSDAQTDDPTALEPVQEEPATVEVDVKQLTKLRVPGNGDPERSLQFRPDFHRFAGANSRPAGSAPVF
jgi:hypothetical protein